MKSKIIIAVAAILIPGLVYLKFSAANKSTAEKQIDIARVETVKSEIQATGSVESENKADLNFQTGGKLIYLPFKEGDSVHQGQEIAGLDQYELQRELTQALNNYRSTRDTFDQTQANNQSGILYGAQKSTLDTTNSSGINGQDEANAINDMVKRILDQNQATLDNSVISVELNNYALELASLTSPINGVITHEDVTTPGVNITPLTTFSISDPKHLVFKAEVLENDIDYVTIGSKATINLANGKSISGQVDKIYPQKTTLNGENIYYVDVKSAGLITSSKLGETGTVLIDNNESKGFLLPTWTIINNNYVWVLNNNRPILRKVKIGSEHGSFTQIIKGLQTGDRVIEDPKMIISNKYSIF